MATGSAARRPGVLGVCLYYGVWLAYFLFETVTGRPGDIWFVLPLALLIGATIARLPAARWVGLAFTSLIVVGLLAILVIAVPSLEGDPWQGTLFLFLVTTPPSVGAFVFLLRRKSAFGRLPD